MSTIIEAHGLTKTYGEVRALDGLDLVAESGRVTALLGPNGAGKTTFISAVATLVRPTSGTLRVAGIDALADPKRVRQVIGLAGQYASVEPAPTPATGWCAPTPVGCAAGWTSAPRSSASPVCCSSTSRPRGSTRAAGWICGTPSVAWSPREPTSC